MNSIEPTDWAGPLGKGHGTLHHIGFVVASVYTVAREFAMSVSAGWDGEIIHDPVQRVRVAFLRPNDPRNPLIELVEPAGEASPVTKFLGKGGGLHHLCYELADLEAGLREARAMGMVIVASPVPAAAFGGGRISCVYSKDRLLMEFLERCQK